MVVVRDVAEVLVAGAPVALGFVGVAGAVATAAATRAVAAREAAVGNVASVSVGADGVPAMVAEGTIVMEGAAGGVVAVAGAVVAGRVLVIAGATVLIVAAPVRSPPCCCRMSAKLCD